MGSESNDITVIMLLSLPALLLAGWSTLQLVMLRKRFDTALGGKSRKSLEALLSQNFEQMQQINVKLQHLGEEYERLAAATSLASQKISIVRFNPFGDTGGDQSFCLAVLDAQDSGYVLTSIHGREGARMYVKPVDFGESKHTLSAEEQQALTQAARRVAKRKGGRHA